MKKLAFYSFTDRLANGIHWLSFRLGKLTPWLLAGAIVYFVPQSYHATKNMERILGALCGPYRQDSIRCEPIERLLNDNAMQTELLETQNLDIIELQKLGICLMKAHGVELPDGVENDVDCEQIAQSFAASSGGTGSSNAGGGGGGGSAGNDGGSAPPPTPEREPVRVFGIPVCVPFTDACVRQGDAPTI